MFPMFPKFTITKNKALVAEAFRWWFSFQTMTISQFIGVTWHFWWKIRYHQQFINLNYNGDAELSKDNQSLKRSTAKCLTIFLLNIIK